MGRAKVTLKRIENDRARKLTFVNRKKGIIKKISEFPADACLIIDDIETNAATVTWPQEPEKLNSFLQRYDHLKKTETRCERFGVEDFFDIKKEMVEAEISKVRKEILKVKYPRWNPGFSNLGVDELRKFIVMLNAKVGLCDLRINMLKNKKKVEGNYGLIQNIVTESEEVGVMQNFCMAENKKTVNENAVMVDSQVDLSRPLESRNLSESRNLPLVEFMECGDLQKTLNVNSVMVDSQIDVSGPSESRNVQLGGFVELGDLQKSLMVDSQVNVSRPSGSRNLPLGEFMELADFWKTINANSLLVDSQVDMLRPSESRNLPLGEFTEWDDSQKTVNGNSVMVDSQVDVSQQSESRNLPLGEFMESGDLQKTINEKSVMVDSQVDVSRPSEPRNLPLGELMQWDDLEPLVEHPTPKVWANQLVEDNDWAKQLEDWAFLPDISFLS